MTAPATRPLMPRDRQGDAAADPPQYRHVIGLQVIRVELPAGTVNASEQLWNYLNEEPVTINRSAGLGRNGLRMGLGEGGSWPEVARILEKLTARPLAPTYLTGLPGSVMDVVVRNARPAQSIFLFYQDRTRTGTDYRPRAAAPTILDSRARSTTAILRLASSSGRGLLAARRRIDWRCSGVIYSDQQFNFSQRRSYCERF
jgi:hypothetical protein